MVNKDQIKRRSILKKVGVSGVLALGMSGSASASEVTTDIDSLLSTEKVRSIQDALPDLQLQDQRAKTVAAGPEEDPTFVTHTEIPANFGTLNVVEFADSELEVVFDFKNYRSNLDVDWPRGTDAKLYGAEDGAVFIRGATDAETERVAAAIGKDATEITVSTTSEMDGFRVTEANASSETVEIFRVERGVTADSSTPGLEVVSHEVIDANGGDGVRTASCDCGVVFANVVLCLNQLGVCSLCLGTSLGGPAATIACAIGTGCISIADIWTGCTALVSSRDCVVDCVTSA